MVNQAEAKLSPCRRLRIVTSRGEREWPGHPTYLPQTWGCLGNVSGWPVEVGVAGVAVVLPTLVNTDLSKVYLNELPTR